MKGPKGVTPPTENSDSEDGHTFESIEITGICNIALDNTQTNEGEGTLRYDISDLSAKDALHNSVAEGNFTQRKDERKELTNRQSLLEERPQSESTVN